jgi:hypothetical protein
MDTELSASMTAEAKKPNAGDVVVLVRLPPGLLNDLPQEDQTAIASSVGKPVLLVGYDEDGRAELTFAEAARRGHHHTIWVEPSFIRLSQ